MTKKFLWVFIFGCLLFLLFRVLVLLGATDNIRHSSPEEYQYVTYAQNLIYNGHGGYEFTHLHGQKYTTWFIYAMMKIGLSPTVALKLFALMASFIGFASLLYLIGRYGGIFPAIGFGMLVIFPHETYLKWSLTCWGGYPEAVGFVALPVALLFVSIEKKKVPLYLAAGFLAGLVFSFSISIIYILPAFFLMPFLLLPREKKLKAFGFCFVGFIFGTTPIIWTLLGGIWKEFFETALYISKDALPTSAAITWPKPDHVREIFLGKIANNNGIERWELLLILIGFLWVLMTSFVHGKGEGNRYKWRILFPLTLIFYLLMIPFFNFVYHLDVRHVLWFFIAGYACCAFLLTDQTPLPKFISWKITEMIWIWGRRGILILLIIYHITLTINLIQPSDMGILFNYRGYEYHKIGIERIIGKEVYRTNCILDQANILRNDPDIRYGFASAFLIFENHNKLLMEPYSPKPYEPMDRSPLTEPARSAFFKGLGCAYAVKEIKDYQETLNIISPWSGAFVEGFDHCAAILDKGRD